MITLDSLLFITMIPIDCKITNFSLHLFVCFFLRDHHNWWAPNKLLAENPLASTLHIQSFSAHYTVLWTENSMKTISSITPAIIENMEYTIVKAHVPVIDMKLGVSTWHCVSLCFVSLPASNVWLPFQAKNNARSAPVYTVSLAPKP